MNIKKIFLFLTLVYLIFIPGLLYALSGTEMENIALQYRDCSWTCGRYNAYRSTTTDNRNATGIIPSYAIIEGTRTVSEFPYDNTDGDKGNNNPYYPFYSNGAVLTDGSVATGNYTGAGEAYKMYEDEGFDTPEKFKANLLLGYNAGYMCINPARRIYDQSLKPNRTTGIDCSGFVTRCAGISNRYGTNPLSSFLTEPVNWDNLTKGDIIVKGGKHVVFVQSVSGTTINFIHATGGTIRRVVSDSKDKTDTYFSGYIYRRFNPPYLKKVIIKQNTEIIYSREWTEGATERTFAKQEEFAETGTLKFELFFSKPMWTTPGIAVTFGKSSPYNQHTVTGNWVSEIISDFRVYKKWVGTFAIPEDQADNFKGVCHLSVDAQSRTQDKLDSKPKKIAKRTTAGGWTNYTPGNDTLHQFKIGPPFELTAEPLFSVVERWGSVNHTITVRNNYIEEEGVEEEEFNLTANTSSLDVGWTITGLSLNEVFTLGAGEEKEFSITVTNNSATTPLEIPINVKCGEETKFTEIYDSPANYTDDFDHPDESYDVSNTHYPSEWKVDTESNIGILLNSWGEGLGHLLGKYDIASVPIKADLNYLGGKELIGEDLGVLLIGSGGLMGLDNSAIFKERLAEYVDKGGVVVCFTQQRGYEYRALPKGDEISAYGWAEDQSCWGDAVYIDEVSAMFNGQTDALITANTDGYFTALPVNAKVLLRRRVNGMPALAEYNYGQGRIIVCDFYSDWAYGHTQTSEEEQELIRQIVNYALNPDEPLTQGLKHTPYGNDFDMWITMTDEYVVRGSTATFIVNIRNNTGEKLEGAKIEIFPAHGGMKPYVMATLNGIEVDGYSEASFIFPTGTNFWHPFLGFDLMKDENEILVRNFKGVRFFSPSVDLKLKTGKETYKRGEEVKVFMDLKNLKSGEYDTSLILHVLDSYNQLIESQEIEINLGSKEVIENREIFTFNLGMNMELGLYTIRGEVYSEGSKIGYNAINFELPGPELGLNWMLPEMWVKGENNVSFEIENTGGGDCPEGSLEVVLEDPEGGIIYQAVKEVGFIASGGSNILDFDINLAELKFGTYKIKYNLSYESKEIKGEKEIENNVLIEAEFDKASYRIRDDMNFEIKISNNGVFKQDEMKVMAKTEGLFIEEKLITLISGGEENISSVFKIPEETASGVYDMDVSLELSGGSSYKKTFNFVIPEANLKTGLNKIDYLSGEEVKIEISNKGGVDADYNYDVVFMDAKNIEIYKEENSEVRVMKAGEKGDIRFNLTGDVLSGEYYLYCSCKYGEKTEILNRWLNVSGYSASLAVNTDKNYYLAGSNAELSAIIKEIEGNSGENKLDLKVYGNGDSCINYSDIKNVCRIETDNNFIWFGTKSEGIKRYDKTNKIFENYNESSGLVDNEILNIKAGIGFVWAGTPKGVSRYDKVSGQWVSYTNESTSGGLIANLVNCIEVVGSEVWFGSYNGISIYNQESSEWKSFGSELTGANVLCLYRDGNYVWMGTYDNGNPGTRRYDIISDEWKIYKKEDGLISDSIKVIDGDANNLCFSIGIGFSRYNKVSEQWSNYNIGDVKDLAIEGDNVWLGTGEGIKVYDLYNDDWTTYTKEDGLLGNDITILGIDGEDVWCGVRYEFLNEVNESTKNSRRAGSVVIDPKDSGVSCLKRDGGVIWEVEEKLLGEGTRDYNLILENSGKYSLEGKTENGLGQEISKDRKTFYVLNSHILLSLETSNLDGENKGIYNSGEEIKIKGFVENLGEIGENLSLEINKDGEEVYAESFVLSAMGKKEFILELSNDQTFNVEGKVVRISDGKVLAEVSECVEIEIKGIDIGIISADEVGIEPFEIGVILKNPGKQTVNFICKVTGSKTLDEQEISLDGSGIKVVQVKDSIVSNTIYKVLLSGDVDREISKEITFGPEPGIEMFIEPVYPEGTVEMPYMVTNSGVIDMELEMGYKLADLNDLVIAEGVNNYYLPADGGIYDNVVFKDLAEGNYILSYSGKGIEDLFSGSRLINVARENVVNIVGLEIKDDAMTTDKKIPVKVEVKNIGWNQFIGNISISGKRQQLEVGDEQSKFYEEGRELVLNIGEEKKILFEMPIDKVEAGNYEAEVCVLCNGKEINKKSEGFSLNCEFLISEILSSDFVLEGNKITAEIGKEGTIQVKIKNTGTAGGNGEVHLSCGDIIDGGTVAWFEIGEEKVFDFKVSIPDDLEEKDYPAKVEVINLTETTEKPFILEVKGYKVDVETVFDKELYKEGDIAKLTLNIINTGSMEPEIYCKVLFNDYEETKEIFKLVDTNDVVFNVPVKFTGQKLFYGVYLKSGRSLYLNTLYIYEDNQRIKLIADKQVYNAGEEMKIRAIPGSLGALVINASWGYEKEIIFDTLDEVALTITLPEEMVSGSYKLSYLFKTGEEEESGEYLFDVLGYSLKVTECKLDKDAYNKGEEIKIRFDIESNLGVDCFVKGWINNEEIFNSGINISDGLNVINVEGIIPLGFGMEKFVYSIYKGELVFCSGMEYLDILEEADTVSPVSTLKIEGPEGEIDGKRYISVASKVKVQADDENGIREIWYKINNKDWVCRKAEEILIEGTGSGRQDIEYYSIDKAGNMEYKKKDTLYIDDYMFGISITEVDIAEFINKKPAYFSFKINSFMHKIVKEDIEVKVDGKTVGFDYKDGILSFEKDLIEGKHYIKVRVKNVLDAWESKLKDVFVDTIKPECADWEVKTKTGRKAFWNGDYIEEGDELVIKFFDQGSGVEKIKILMDAQEIENKETGLRSCMSRSIFSGGYEEVEAGYCVEKGIETGLHKLTVEVEDKAGNDNVKNVVFRAGEGLSLDDVVNYPNPCNKDTRFTFQLSRNAVIKIEVYTLSGELVKKLEKESSAGYNEIYWDLSNDYGRGLSSGLYFYRIIAESLGERKKAKGNLVIKK